VGGRLLWRHALLGERPDPGGISVRFGTGVSSHLKSTEIGDAKPKTGKLSPTKVKSESF
jgi:hypothetical protein